MKKGKMKAVVCTTYGLPDVLKVTEVYKPIPNENEILIKIVAAAVNSGDVRIRGLHANYLVKILMRIIFGFFKPRKSILGTVYSGFVAEVGSNADNFSIGDEVYGFTGFKFGTYAEYITVNHKSVVTKKPKNATHEEAAAIAFGGQTAHYFLDKANIAQLVNGSVLIYGASGAVGASAIQIAKYYNAKVTAVCSEQGQYLVKEIGADDIILYDKTDFTKCNKKFDIVFDAVGKITKKDCVHLLKKEGNFLTVGGMGYATPRVEQLEFLSKLFEIGKYNATIDRVYNLDEIVEAHKYVDLGRKKGNVVVKIV